MNKGEQSSLPSRLLYNQIDPEDDVLLSIICELHEEYNRPSQNLANSESCKNFWLNTEDELYKAVIEANDSQTNMLDLEVESFLQFEAISTTRFLEVSQASDCETDSTPLLSRQQSGKNFRPVVSSTASETDSISVKQSKMFDFPPVTDIVPRLSGADASSSAQQHVIVRPTAQYSTRLSTHFDGEISLCKKKTDINSSRVNSAFASVPVASRKQYSQQNQHDAQKSRESASNERETTLNSFVQGVNTDENPHLSAEDVEFPFDNQGTSYSYETRYETDAETSMMLAGSGEDCASFMSSAFSNDSFETKQSNKGLIKQRVLQHLRDRGESPRAIAKATTLPNTAMTAKVMHNQSLYRKRNRDSARRIRQRVKNQLQNLEKRKEVLDGDILKLKKQLVELENEAEKLRNILSRLQR